MTANLELFHLGLNRFISPTVLNHCEARRTLTAIGCIPNLQIPHCATRSVIPVQMGIHRYWASVIDSHLRRNDADSCKSGMLLRHFHYFESLLTIADKDNAIASIPSDFRYAMSVNLGFHGGTFHPESLSGRCPSSAV
jgi:hypothetical protein